MEIELNPVERVRVSSGTALRRRGPRRPASLARIVVSGLVGGFAVGLLALALAAPTPGSVLLLGGTTLAYALISFGVEAP